MSQDGPIQYASRSGRWFKRLGLTLTSLAMLVGFYSLYAMILRPVVEPPGMGPRPTQNQSTWAPPPPPQGVEMAKLHLASQPWAADAEYVIRTDEAFVYFEEWEPIDEDEAVRFTPFAMIWMPKGRKENEKPITIISTSAWVKFAHKFRLTSPDAGRVVAGSLEGAVQIEGDKGLKILGRNFVFQEKHMRVWCDHPVDFTYGPHKGNGHSMQIDLIPDEVARAQDKLAVKGFKTVRLRRNVSMDLEFREGESDQLIAGDSDKAAPPFAEKPATPKKPKEPTIVNVRSAGSFAFDVETNVATFEDNVRVYQPTEKGKYNSLQSDFMTLYFEPKEKPKPQTKSDPFAVETPAAESQDSFRSVDSNLTFRRLVANGENVILRSETNDLIATMHQLDYDTKTRLAKLTSRNLVRVLQKQSEMQCPVIELLHAENGRVSELWAKGAGGLKSLDEKTSKLAFAAYWKKLLHKHPDARTGLDIIELENEALISQPLDQFGLAADYIWLELEQEIRSRANNSENAGNGSSDRESNRMRPKKLLAKKNVAIVSPEMQGRSHRLEVVFEPALVPYPDLAEAKRSRADLQPAIRQVPGQTASANTPNQPSVTLASQSRSKNEIPLPPLPSESPSSSEGSANETKSDSSANPDTKKKKPSDDGPIDVTSDVIRVKVLTYGKNRKSEVSEVVTEGHVEVWQQHGPDAKPLHMTGERMHVLNRSQDDQVMTLWGSPGHVRDRGLHIEGKKIFLDRAANQSNVTGAGLLQLPVKRSLDGEDLKEPKPLDVWWTESMTFDGLNAKFFGDVRAVLNNDGMRSNMRCEEMDVQLTERISFADNRGSEELNETNAEVSRVYCKDGVEFDSYKYEESKLSEVRRGRFAEFTLNQTTGDTLGQGPGEIKVWQRGQGKRAGMTPNATVKANKALAPESTEWEYMRIDFDGIAKGNTKQKFNTFHEDVQIIYGPVERSLMEIELINVQTTKDAGSMRCQNLRITQNEPPSPEETGPIDLLATGNVYLEGRTVNGIFNASADSISYDESKGLYTLRSQGQFKAMISRQAQLGGERSQASAQLMQFIPSRNSLKLDHATGLDGVN